MLGGLRARRGADLITRFKSQKVATLLAYLAFYPSRPHLRDELVAWLWPDDDLEATRNRLRVTLSSLRRQIEPPGTGATMLLMADRTTVRLRPEAFTTDVAQFENAYTAALHDSDESEHTRLLMEAVEAYHGELLPGLYDEWVLSERERLAQAHLEALRRLTVILANRQDNERALHYARLALQSDQLQQEAHHKVMRLLLAVGQPSAALQQYRELVGVCREAFGAEPAPFIQALARQISIVLGQQDETGTHPLSARAAASLSRPNATEMSRGAISAAPETPPAIQAYRLPISVTQFFGREQELATLYAWLTFPRSTSGSAHPATS